MNYKETAKKMMLVNILKRTAMREAMGEIHWGQEPILEYLCTHSDSSQKDIAQFLHVTPASIALSTKRMEKSGLITKISDTQNLRRNVINITEKGKKTQSMCSQRRDSIVEHMFQGFSEKDLEIFSSYFDKIIFNFTGESKEITPEVFGHYISKLKMLDLKSKEKKRGKNEK